jgi:hypothetical protein
MDAMAARKNFELLENLYKSSRTIQGWGLGCGVEPWRALDFVITP